MYDLPILSELREQLRNSDAKLMTQARNEEQLRKELEKMREQANRDQKMLSMRSDLINNLQENEKESQNKINKMYYQANEKDTLLKQVQVPDSVAILILIPISLSR